MQREPWFVMVGALVLIAFVALTVYLTRSRAGLLSFERFVRVLALS